MPDDAIRAPYHHGDARNALLRAASGLLATEAAAELSLRQVAERAGLSRQAPYRHFEDKEALLAELAREGLDRLARTVRGMRGQGGLAGLASALEAYIGFAQDEPALFRMMFSRELVDRDRHGPVAAATDAVRDAVAEAVDALGESRASREVQMLAWSMVHGSAVLGIEAGMEGRARRRGHAGTLARAIRRLRLTAILER